ncbi:MAG: hypothetical protein WDW38_008108 [Sanguina aurantia]
MAREGLSSASLQGAVPRISRLHPEFDFDTAVKANRERRWHSPVEEYALYAADLAQLIKALLPLLEVLSLRLNAPAADMTETELVEARPEAGTSASQYAKGLRSIYHIPQPLPNLLNVVVVTINNLAAESGGTGYPEELAFLNHPAVAHLLKLIVIMDPESRQPCRLNLMQDSIRGLSYLLYRRMNVDHAYLTKDREPKTALERRENSDMDGLPLQLSAFCSEAALKTDASLLHALRKHDAASDTEEVTAWRYEVQGLMLKLWVNESKVFPSTSGQLMEMAKNVVGAAAECAVIGLQLLLAHKAETAPLQQQQQRRRGFATLELWCTMPGWAAATEVMHRGKDPAGQANEISHAAVLLADSLSLLTGDVDFSMLHHSVSLAWTVRKLMWPYVQRGCRTSTAESRDAFSDTVGMTSDERPRSAFG